jgi:3-hydroxyacyl-CoA dehydrogenase/enoyl-CoA hydratase/3-hydroxybutyryl-CoA epimerase
MRLFESQSAVVERDSDGSAVLILDVPGRPVNVFTRQVLADLDAALGAVTAVPRLPLLVVRSGKKTGFLAGADLHEFLKVRDADSARALSEVGQKLFDRLAALPVPTLAVIHGPCLGGGLELALACDYRLVFDRSNTQLGLPEVELGLLPGWGGTQRLPRVVGLERALQVILAGRRLGARDALRWGLADAVASNEAELRKGFAALCVRAVGQGKRPRDRLPLRNWRQRLLESNALGRRVVFKATERLLRKKVPDDMPAPAEALEAVKVGLQRGHAAGLAREREGAARLAVSTACQNLVTLFFQREQARKLPARALALPDVKKVGVVGAGVMGAGIAQLAAIKGCEVVVQEVNAEALAAGQKRIAELFAKAVERRILTAEEAAKHQAAIKGTVGWQGFDAVEVVVEAAVEDLQIKRNLFRELEARTPPTAVLATNTSSLPVGQLQEGAKHPERIAGLHFFNPVHKMPLVEVARAARTDEKAVLLLTRFAIALGKTPVLVGDGPGFVVNRILMPYLNEAVVLAGEGLRIKELDRLMQRFGMPMGPLALLDSIGLDVAAHVARVMGPALKGRFAPNPAFERMCERGWLGQKSGQGFYIHQGKKSKPNPDAEELVRQGASGPALAALPPLARLAQARERMVLLMVNEAARVVGEGLADVESVDLAMVFGTGWAPHRGGPLRYADDRGLGEVVQALQGLTGRLGPRFEPSQELKRRAEAKETFRKPPWDMTGGA